MGTESVIATKDYDSDCNSWPHDCANKECMCHSSMVLRYIYACWRTLLSFNFVSCRVPLAPPLSWCTWCTQGKKFKTHWGHNPEHSSQQSLTAVYATSYRPIVYNSVNIVLITNVPSWHFPEINQRDDNNWVWSYVWGNSIFSSTCLFFLSNIYLLCVCLSYTFTAHWNAWILTNFDSQTGLEKPTFGLPMVWVYMWDMHIIICLHVGGKYVEGAGIHLSLTPYIVAIQKMNGAWVSVEWPHQMTLQ